MTKDDFKEILSMPEINASGIASKMFEGIKNPRVRLNAKVNELRGGNGNQRLTEDDLEKAMEVLKHLAGKINKAIG